MLSFVMFERAIYILGLPMLAWQP